MTENKWTRTLAEKATAAHAEKLLSAKDPLDDLSGSMSPAVVTQVTRKISTSTTGTAGTTLVDAAELTQLTDRLVERERFAHSVRIDIELL